MESIDLTRHKYKIVKIKKKEKTSNHIIIKIILFLIFFLISFSLGLVVGSRFLNKKSKYIDRRNPSAILNINSFTTYSQYLEDFVLYCIFYDIEKGFYIDVGANSPDSGTVTKAFYLNGWHGINIEPLPEEFSSLKEKRERDINLNIGAGEKEENLTLYAKGPLSTLKEKFAQSNNNKINIQVLPMSTICEKYVPKNEEIQFCKIDVEGNEKSVLLGYDFKNYRPKVFVVESAIPNTDIPCHEEWEYILLKNDYVFGYQYKINRFYYDKRRDDDISQKFINLNSSVESYQKIPK